MLGVDGRHENHQINQYLATDYRFSLQCAVIWSVLVSVFLHASRKRTHKKSILCQVHSYECHYSTQKYSVLVYCLFNTRHHILESLFHFFDLLPSMEISTPSLEVSTTTTSMGVSMEVNRSRWKHMEVFCCFHGNWSCLHGSWCTSIFHGFWWKLPWK